MILGLWISPYKRTAIDSDFDDNLNLLNGT